jgi:hypothetical protein
LTALNLPPTPCSVDTQASSVSIALAPLGHLPQCSASEGRSSSNLNPF